MTLKPFAWLVLLSVLSAAQNAPKSIALADQSDLAAKDIEKGLRKECPNVTVTPDLTKSDYTLEATKRRGGAGILDKTFYLTLFDREGRTVIAISNESLGHSVKDVCHAIRTSVLVEVVDSQNLTQSKDARGDTSGGAAQTVVNGLTGRRTHTDSSMMYVIVNGEHVLLDCYERHTGCTTIGLGTYYGQLDGGSIWVNYAMPLTHQPLRNHYKIAGSW